MNIIEAVGISKRYQVGDVIVDALKSSDIHIEEKDIISIIGKSGSGKSTLMSVLGGILVPEQGKVLLKGQDLYQLSEDERTKLRRKEIGFVFQNFNLIDELTVLENIRLPFDIQNRKYDKEYEQYLISILGIKERLNFYPHRLSGGERQRVAIARALLLKPSVILADEPTGNLDTVSGEQFMECVRVCNQNLGQTFVIVTHNMELAMQATRVLHMVDGNLEY